jgi:hypothetical protein
VSPVPLQPAAGETVYVQLVIVPGVWRGGGRLLQVDPEEARGKIAKLKPLHGEEKEEKP